MKVEGTLNEIKKLGEDIEKLYYESDNELENVVVKIFDRYGWITKPEWKQAYV